MLAVSLRCGITLYSNMLPRICSFGLLSKAAPFFFTTSQKHQIPFRYYSQKQSGYPNSSDISQALDGAYVGSDHPVDDTFPSDVLDNKPDYKTYNDWNRDQSKHSFRPRVDPSTTSVLLFPGQGSQFKGMGKSLLEYPNVRTMFEIAGSILNYNLLDICINGPDERLNKTEFCQPAIFVCSLAAIEKLRHEDPNAILNCVTTAGFSVGELSALTFAGALTFEEGISLVKVRAEAMQRASESQASGMMTVFLGPESRLPFACAAAERFCREKLGIENAVCRIANYLYPECKVVAGNQEALQFLEKAAKDFGLRRMKRLPVSGAFHSNLMKPAANEFREALKNVDLKEPIIPVLNNVTSHRFGKPASIPRLMTEQIYKPVKWEQILHVLYERKQGNAFPRTYEVGPGRQLGALLKAVNRKAHLHYSSVEV